jgi:hypothetical protein
MSYGWLRWTANPTPTQPDGSLNPFIEEIQTDFGQHLDEKANVLNIPTDHVKTIREVLFGDKDPGEFLHEAWKEFQRKEGRLVPYSMFHATAKAPISLGSVIKDIPVHMQETYNAIPKTMGMKDSTYHKDQDVKEAAYHHLQVSSDATPVKTIVGRVEKKAVERNNLRKTVW